MRAVKIKHFVTENYQPESVWYGPTAEAACLYISPDKATCIGYGFNGVWTDCNVELGVESRLYVMEDGTLKVEHA